jgi:hypothetical protein
MSAILFPPAQSNLDGVQVSGTPVDGQLLVATSSNTADWQTLSDAWIPSDNGYLAAPYDPAIAQTSTVLVAGTLYLVKVAVRYSFTWTNVRFNINTLGAGTSAGSYFGLYSPSGTLLTGSADAGSVFTGSTGSHGLALTTPQALSPANLAFVWAAVLCNMQTTQVKLSSVAASAGNDNLAVSSYRYATNSPAATTVASGSNGGEISNIGAWSSPSAGVLDVATTTGWPTSGSLAVAASGSTLAEITYTGVSGNSFTGCAYVSGSATGTVATGGAVTMASLPAAITPSSNTSSGALAFFLAAT